MDHLLSRFRTETLRTAPDRPLRREDGDNTVGVIQGWGGIERRDGEGEGEGTLTVSSRVRMGRE